MIGLDTNVLARYYVAGADADGADLATQNQRVAAGSLPECACFPVPVEVVATGS